MCKTAVKSSPPTNQHPTFYRLDALPVTQPTVSKHWREDTNKADYAAKMYKHKAVCCIII